MAEGGSVRQDDVVCRYFMSSSCRDGDRCPFSHQSTRGTADSVCRYYLRGRCVYGRNCRYDHIRVNKQGNSKSHPHNDRHSAGHSRHSTYRDASNNYTRYKSNCFPTQEYTRTPDSVCRNYQQGKCVYGKNCRYDHVRVNREDNSHSVNDGHSAGPSRHSTHLDASSNYTRSESNRPNTHQPKFNVLSQNTKDFIPHELKKKAHKEQSEKDLEKDMALAFAIQKSMDKTCGICMDVVLEKENFSERKFGILEKCNHVYCFSCISKWRRSNHHLDYSLDSDITKACPECRITSDFVTPSEYLVDTDDEKEKLITQYKKALSQKNCKYFKKGKGTCVFGDTCLYLHAKPDGTKVELPPPTTRRQQIEVDVLDYIYRQLSSIDPFNNDLYYDDWDESDYMDDESDYMDDELEYMSFMCL